MIRVLHSVSNMDRGGIETMLMNYYRHIDRDKVQFDFLCNKSKPGAYDQEILAMGGRIFRTPGLNPAKYHSYLRYMRNLFETYPEYRIVEAHNGALGVYALYAAKKQNIPIRIFHAHGASIEKDWKLPLKMVCKAVLPFTTNYRFSCGIEAARCYFGDAVVEKFDFEIIHNAIDIKKFKFDKNTRRRLRAENGLDGKKVIGHVGRFAPQKNHDFLIDVFYQISKRDDKAVLVLLGDGYLQSKIRRKVSNLGLSDKVLFVGNVGNANEWYNVFDIFVLPSKWEGLPVVGVEALTNGLPCIFSDNVTREICICRNSVFIPSYIGMDQWCNFILGLMSDQDRDDMTELITKKGYNIDIEAVKLQNRYLELNEVGV